MERDDWEQACRGLEARTPGGREALAALARQYLRRRGDSALGFGPLGVLPAARHDAWLLLWAAARRVDDAIEDGRARVRELFGRLSQSAQDTFAERLVQSFLHEAADVLSRQEAVRLLRRGLRGLEAEGAFTRPRTVRAYWELLKGRSAPPMEILDALLFQDVPTAARRRHALFFSASTQIGDDCRDALRDLGRGRCFVTREEVMMLARPSESLEALVQRTDFARLRTAWSRQCLDAAASVAETFGPADRERAERLDRLWRAPLQDGQVRCTDEPLHLSPSARAGPVENLLAPRA